MKIRTRRATYTEALEVMDSIDPSEIVTKIDIRAIRLGYVVNITTKSKEKE